MDKKIGVINYNFSDFELEKLFRWCSERKVDYVELQRENVWPDIENSENNIAEVAKLIAKYGVKISQISSRSDFLQKTAGEMDKQVWMVGEMCRMVKDLGFKQLRIDGGWHKEGVEEQDHRRLVMDGIRRVTEIAEKEGVYLALDNHGKVTNNYLFQLEIFNDIKSKYLGANLDTMNYRWYGYPVEELTGIYRKIAPYTFHTHMKDGITEEKFSYVKRVLGEGEVPLVDTIKILKDAGYNGVWCVEYEGTDGAVGYGRGVEWLEKNL